MSIIIELPQPKIIGEYQPSKYSLHELQRKYYGNRNIEFQKDTNDIFTSDVLTKIGSSYLNQFESSSTYTPRIKGLQLRQSELAPGTKQFGIDFHIDLPPAALFSICQDDDYGLLNTEFLVGKVSLATLQSYNRRFGLNLDDFLHESNFKHSKTDIVSVNQLNPTVFKLLGRICQTKSTDNPLDLDDRKYDFEYLAFYKPPKNAVVFDGPGNQSCLHRPTINQLGKKVVRTFCALY